MKLLKLWTIFALMAASTSIHAASFDCKQAATDVEKMICRNYELSNMDSKLARFYGEAREAVVDPNVLRSAQREWLEERNRCTDVRCLKKRYDRRIDELRVLAAGHKLWEPPPAMTPEDIERKYVDERRMILKEFFKDRPLKLTLGTDDHLCREFMRDFAAQNEEVELVPPTVVVHDYDDARLQQEIFDYCPDMELRSHKIGVSGPYVGPRNFLLYNVDIDNQPENSKELLFLEESIWMRSPKYGREIIAKNKFRLIELPTCRVRGSSATGASQHYSVNFDVFKESPQTGLHGIVLYHGAYFIYDVVDHSPKAPPLALVEYNQEGFDSFKTRCRYLSQHRM